MFTEIECQVELSLMHINEIRAKYNLAQLNTEEEFCESEVNDEEDILKNEEFVFSEPSNDKVKKEKRVRGKRETANVEKLYEFICHVCELKFHDMRELSNHCSSIHQDKPKVQCWCGSILNSWKRLMAHKSKHTKKKEEFSCTECKTSYNTLVAYEKHFQSKHGPDKIRYICSQCGKEFKERQILKNHEKIHLPEELRPKCACIECEKTFVNSHSLKIHVARVHRKIALHTCELCGKGCITRSDLKWHMVGSISINYYRLSLKVNFFK